VHFALVAVMRPLETRTALSLALPEGGIVVVDGLLSFLPGELSGRAPTR
jgi:hypothetical protein